MVLRKNVAVKPVLNFDDRKKVVAFVQLLMAIDKRVKANPVVCKEIYGERKETNKTRKKRNKLEDKISPLKSRALLFVKGKSGLYVPMHATHNSHISEPFARTF